MLSVFLSCSLPYFLRHLSLNLDLTNRLDCMASKPQGPSYLHLPRAGVAGKCCSTC